MALFDLVTSLPTALSGGILRDWVNYKALVGLDSAYCNRSHRKQFLTILKSDEIVLHEPLTFVNIQWVFTRGLSMSHLVLGKDVDASLLGSYVTRFGQKARSVRFVAGASPTMVSLVATHCHELTKILLNNGDIITPEFREVLISNPKLEVLHIIALRWDVLDRNTATFDAIRLPKLRVVCIYLPHFQFAQNMGVLAMGPNIQVLDLTAARIPELVRIADACPNLRALSLRSASTCVTDASIAAITLACPEIAHLNLRNTLISDAGILSVVTNLKGLRSLNISGCDDLSSQSLKHIYAHCSSSLHTLCLSASTESGPLLEHEEVACLLRRCSQLRTLGWSEYAGYDDEVGEVRPKYTFTDSIRHLTSVSLLDEALHDGNLLAVAQHCTELRTLSVTFPHESHDIDSRLYSLEGFAAIAQRCPRLRDVVLEVPTHAMHPLALGGAPHDSILPVVRLLQAARPEVTLHLTWSGDIEKRFEFNVTNMLD